MTGGQLHHERVGEPCQGVVNGVADVAVIDAHAIGCRNELDDLAGVERTVDRVERSGVRRPVLCEGERHLAQGRPDGVDPREVLLHQRVVARDLGTHAIGALAMDHATVDEPRERRVERRELVHRETIFGVVGVQEVEGVLEIHVMGVTAVDGIRSCVGVHVITTLWLLTGYAQKGKVQEVTD